MFNGIFPVFSSPFVSYSSVEEPQSTREHLLADLKRCQLEVSTNPDITDDINVFLVWKLEFMVIRKLHLKHVSSQLQHNLKMKNRENLEGIRKLIPHGCPSL